MEWTEVKIYTTREGIEPLSAMLLETGVKGVQIEDTAEIKEFVTTSSKYWDYVDEELLNKKDEAPNVKIYVSNNPYGMEILAKVKEGLERLKTLDMEVDMGSLEYELSNSDDEDWLNKWKEYYKPFNVGERLLVKPVWEEVENKENRVVLNINPGHVFGTGLHQTTQLCMLNLEKYVNEKSSVLDLGCGSGILSIVSLLLGAKAAMAVDIDANAVKTAYENAEYNGITKENYTVLAGNIIDDVRLQEKVGYEKYDVVVANIIADVIIAISDLVPKQMKKDGVFISSGIIKDRLEDVYEALKSSGFEIVDTKTKDEWVSVTAKLKG